MIFNLRVIWQSVVLSVDQTFQINAFFRTISLSKMIFVIIHAAGMSTNKGFFMDYMKKNLY